MPPSIPRTAPAQCAMRRFERLTRLGKAAALAYLTAACSPSGAKDRPKAPDRPLVAALADTVDEPLILISGAARAALDSANALYKAKRYTHALAAYRSAARLAPTEPAPLLGMLMTATMIEDERLADSLRVALRAMTPAPNAATTKRAPGSG